jgi:hypothetical protein
MPAQRLFLPYQVYRAIARSRTITLLPAATRGSASICTQREPYCAIQSLLTVRSCSRQNTSSSFISGGTGSRNPFWSQRPWMTRLSPWTGEMVSYREPNRKCEGEGPFSPGPVSSGLGGQRTSTFRGNQRATPNTCLSICEKWPAWGVKSNYANRRRVKSFLCSPAHAVQRHH